MAHKFHGGSTSKDHGAHEEGPVATPMEWVPGDPKDMHGDSGDCHDGIPGYPMGNGGKAPELTFVEDGAWGRTKYSNFKEDKE